MITMSPSLDAGRATAAAHGAHRTSYACCASAPGVKRSRSAVCCGEGHVATRGSGLTAIYQEVTNA